MQHKTIHPEIVAETERLLAEGQEPAAIAERLGISPFVVEVIAGDDQNRDHPAPLARHQSSHANAQAGVDIGTIRSVQRMLAQGNFNYSEIARQLGISGNIVSAVAKGKRKIVTTEKPILSLGERFHPAGIRCKGCHKEVHVAPCRICLARLAKRVKQFFQKKKKSAPTLLSQRFSLWEFFVLLVGTFNHFFGGKTMPDLLPFLSAEISALLSVKDKREGVIAFAEKLFDQVITKIDLPGPDAVIDPLLRAAIRPLVGRIYDQIAQKLEATNHA